MTVIRFDGEVNTDDDEPSDYDGGYPYVTIGGRPVLSELNGAETAFRGAVTVGIAGERFVGSLSAWDGMRAYSEWTPGNVGELTVGPHDLIEVLRRYDGQAITMWVADEPVDLGAEP